jgi:hypothetical protein
MSHQVEAARWNEEGAGDDHALVVATARDAYGAVRQGPLTAVINELMYPVRKLLAVVRTLSVSPRTPE